MPDQPLPRAESAAPPVLVLNRSASVCIVTHEFAGLPGSGGIGTAYAGLAQALTAAGHAVTVLCTGLLPVPVGFEREGAFERGEAEPAIVRLPDSPAGGEGDRFLRLSHEVFLWLAPQRFDVVHFADWTGLGFCAVAAKRQGLAFADTTLAVGLHGPTRWVRSATGGGLEGLDELAVDFLERRAAEGADVVVSPSRYLIDWLRQSGWALPARAEVRQNVLPRPAVAPPVRPDAGPSLPVRELVFFGRLETRKGVTLFCDALDRLAAGGGFAETRVTFLGGSAPVDGEDGAGYVRRRAAAWPWPVEFRHGLSSAAALDYLAGAGRLAVIPSRIENSPCTVAECLTRGLPFVASRVGGTAELIVAEDAAQVLFAPEPDTLAATLAARLRDGAPLARLRLAQEDVAADWCAWHVAEAQAIRPAVGDSRIIADPAALGYALLANPRLKLVAGAVERMTSVAARTGAAIVTGAVEGEGGHRRWLAPGGPAALAAWRDVAGPGPLLVRRDCLEDDALDADAVARNAWLTRRLLAGDRIEVMPVVLATTAEPAALVALSRTDRLAPFLAVGPEAGPDGAVADLARLALGLEARAARAVADCHGLAAAGARAAQDRRALLDERNRLAAALEATTSGTDGVEWRACLSGLLDSRSWQLATALRRRCGGVADTQLAGLPPDRAVRTVLASAWWELTAPWRLAGRLAGRLSRRLRR